MELVWEDPPITEGPFFTKDAYDEYSLAPNIRELWAFLQRPSEDNNIKQSCDKGAAKASCSSSTRAADYKDDSLITKEESCSGGCDDEYQCADNAVPVTGNSKDTKKQKAEHKQVKNETDVGFPEPRLPYPCVSRVNSKEQMIYLGFLMSKKEKDPPQGLKEKVDNEVLQFMRYLQDVAKMCAEDYVYMSMGAMQYSEEFFMSCLDYIKTFPQFYQIHEVTSLTGGTFNPRLKLTFEKQLLIMGNVDITDHAIVPADAQLASDYQSVSSENPPAKKAKDMHATISGDSNAVSMCDRYEPHVCLTRNALVRLLDNHGPDFGEQWELPVFVKSNCGKGNSQKKTVYVDSPFLKTEMTVREKSHIYHEESLKLSIKRNGSKNVFHLMTELPVDELPHSPESSKRNIVSLENCGLDFDVDLTDLETFGETNTTKTTKMQELQNEPDAGVKIRKAALNTTNKTSDNLKNTEEINTQLTKKKGACVTETIVPKPEPMRSDSVRETKEDIVFTEESDDDKLVIDDSVSHSAVITKQSKSKTTPCSSDSPTTPVSDSMPPISSSPPKVPKLRRSKRGKVSGDQLGEILQMQTAMFNSANDSAKGSTSSQESNSPARCTVPPVFSHPKSLVKPCVSSYLERNQNPDAENLTSPQESAPAASICTENKKILSQDLQAGAEDEQDYEAPEEGNLLYKLYSLQDLLLLVRSSVSLTHTRRLDNGPNQHVPVHVLPKLEYQLSYGVECLSSSEACQLWTDTALHSSTVSYIAHINAHTSKVALLRKLPDDWKQNISCGFKPSKSLNILHHLLKKLTGLDEGQYLIAHKAGEPFVTLLKAAKGKVNRGAYNLQQAHSSVPQSPASGLVPWIPVDPSVVLPFHQKHSRVPCTFPPKPFIKTGNDAPLQFNSQRPGKNNPNARGKNKKEKKKSRAAKRDAYMKNRIQQSI